MYLSKDQILARGVRRRQDAESPVFGGTLCLQELSRWDYKLAAQLATIPSDPDKVYVQLWDAATFAAGVVDPATGEPLFTHEEVATFREDMALWDEIARIAGLVRALSEVGPESLKSGGAAAHAGRGRRSDRRDAAERGAAAGAGSAGSDG